MRVLSTAFCWFLSGLLLSPQLHAEPSLDPDPAVPTGIVLTAAGSAALVTGGVVFGTSEKTFVNDVVELDNPQLLAGSLLLGTGAGLVTAGLPAMLGGLFAPHAHMSDGRMVAGIVLLGLAAGGAGMGTAFFVNHDVPDREFPASLSWGFSSGFLTIGLPLLVSGAAPPEKNAGTYSPAMTYAGYAVFGIGGAIVTGASLGLTQSLIDPCEGGLCGWELASITILSVGATVIATAIPLVARGSCPKPASTGWTFD